MRYLWMIERAVASVNRDENSGFIIVADTEDTVRRIAMSCHCDEGAQVWLSPTTLVTQLGVAHNDVGVDSPVILKNYIPG